jgi:iron complex transport system ATP-binding protein
MNGRDSKPDRLATEALTCGYGRGNVLSGVDLDVEAGTILALLGPNGSGKSTLLRTLARLLRPHAGVVLLDGESLWARGPIRAHRRVAIAAQEDAGGSTLTVAEVVRLGRAAHRGWWRPMVSEDLAAIDRAIDRADLGRLRDRPVAELSDGEWQRALLARALAQEPVVLLLDEPTAHLDLKYQVDILEVVEALAHEEGLSVVTSLHDVNQAATWADRIALLAEGQLLAVGPPEAVLTPDLLERAYGCPVVVERHPATGILMVLPRRRTRRASSPAGGLAP